MGMETSEILFTRQRHEAKRAGLHYDIRLVHGDVAYSWATKLDMPKPGEAITLHQQPIHDSAYALSKKVIIPDGQYGAGITHLDFVRRAQLKKSEDGDHFTIHTKEGERYLLKHIPKYGPKVWLFKNLTGIGKDAPITKQASDEAFEELLAKFKPDVTPDQMKLMGVLEGKYTKGVPEKDNFFKTDASMKEWPEEWLDKKTAPLGWYEWYQGWSAGKRTEDDARQIKRWLSFKARHLAQLQKADPTLSDLSVQPRRRQALLNWGIAPGIDTGNIEKKASVFVGAALGHLTQNAITSLALRNKSVAKHLADHFATGYAGKSANSLKSKVGGALTHAVAPDISIAAKGANKLGKQLRRYEPFLDKKDKVALRMASEGRFSDIHKYKLHERPMVQRVMGRLGKSHGVDLDAVLKSDKTHDLEKVWQDKKHPLLSNISSNITKGKPIAGATHKTVRTTGALASSLGLAIAEPGTGALSAVKHLASSATVRKNKIGGALTHHIENMMVKNPVKKGWEQGKDYKDNAGKKLFEHVVSPTSAHLQRTSAAVSGVVKNAEIKGMVKAAREKLEVETQLSKQDLRPHTLRALKKIEKQDGLLVDHSMGSGKTLLYLKAIEKHQQKNPKDNVLVIAPASLTTNVLKEIKKHGVKIDTSRLETLSYEKAAIDAERLKQKVYGMVVADEAHKLRNTGTKRHRELSQVITNAKKRILGTGTTAYNNPSDIAPLVNLAAGKRVLPENKAEFEENFIDKIVEQPPLLKRILGHAPREIHKLKNTKALEKILRKHIDHYDLRDDPSAADKFPTKVESVKTVEMSPEQRGLYKYMEGRLPWHLRYKVRMNMALDKKEMASLNSFSTGVRQVSNSLHSYMPNYHKTTPKIDAAVESVHEGYKKDKNFKALVYSNYLGSGLEDYSHELTKREVPHAIYHGGLSKAKKDELLEAYNQGKIPILLLSSSGAEGLNTKGTKKVQILEPHFNRSKIDQVVARGVRYQSHQHLPKSERKVEVEHFITSLPKPKWNIGPKQHSIDEYLHHNSQTKHEIGQQLKELVKEAEDTTPLMKVALNAFKARAMADKVGIIADHTTQWKYGLRKLRNSNGVPLVGEDLAKAKAKIGAIHKDDFKTLQHAQHQYPERELGFAVDKHGRVKGDLTIGTSDSVATTYNPRRGERSGHSHPVVNEGGFHTGPRIAHPSGMSPSELPFKPRTANQASHNYGVFNNILRAKAPHHIENELIDKHVRGIVGKVDLETGETLAGGVKNPGADMVGAVLYGKINGVSRAAHHNIISAEHGVDAAHKSTGVINRDGAVLLTKHRTVMFKHSSLMVKCVDMLEKEAFFDRPQHDYVRAKYKESTDYSNVKDPVASIKRDGAAFFMEIMPDGTPRFLSRRESVKGGFPDRTANVMHLPNKKVPQLAGNVYHVELFHTGKEYNDEILDSHPAVSGILNSKPERAKATQALTGPVRAMLLDVIKPAIHTYGEKMEHLQEVKTAFGDVPNLHMPAFKIGKDAIDQLIKDTKAQGHEGVIVVSKSEPDADAVRVKVKHVDTYNLRVTGIVQEIDKNGNPKKSMGALEVSDAVGRAVAKVGTGFTRSLREEIWNNPKDWIGRAIQVKAMPTTASRLRSPVYNGIADGDIDTVEERLV